MKQYEKPIVEVIDFTAENVMSDGGVIGDHFSPEQGNEPL